MAVTLEFNNLIINFEGESMPPLNLKVEEGDRLALILSRDYYDRAILHFLHLLIEDFVGEAMFCGKNFGSFDGDTLKQWYKNFSSVSLALPMLSNLKIIENIYLPVFYRENIKEDVLFERAYNILCAFGIDKKFNVLPAFLSNFEKKLVLLARAKLSEPAIIYYENIFNDMDDEKRHFYLQKVVDFHAENSSRIVIVSIRTENELKNLEKIGFNKVIKI